MPQSHVRGPGCNPQLCKCQLQALLHSYGPQSPGFWKKTNFVQPRLAFQRHQLPFQTLLSCCLFSEAANLCISRPRLRSNFDHGASSYACNQCGQREEQALPWNHILPATVQVTLPPEMHHSDVLAHWSHGCESRNYPWHRGRFQIKMEDQSVCLVSPSLSSPPSRNPNAAGWETAAPAAAE